MFHVTLQRCEHSLSPSLLMKVVLFLQCIRMKIKVESVVIYVVAWQVFSKYVNKWIALACPFQGNSFSSVFTCFLFFGVICLVHSQFYWSMTRSLKTFGYEHPFLIAI